MPIKKVFEGTVDYLQILDKDGKVDKKLEPKLSKETLDKMYRYMVLGRKWDKKCIALQRTELFLFSALSALIIHAHFLIWSKTFAAMITLQVECTLPAAAFACVLFRYHLNSPLRTLVYE